MSTRALSASLHWRSWVDRALGSYCLQLVLLLLVQRASFDFLLERVPLRTEQYYEPVLSTQHLHGRALLFLAPVVTVVALPFGFRRLVALVPGSRLFAKLLVGL